MKTSLPILIAAAFSTLALAAQAAPLSIKPGEYETHVESVDGGDKPDTDRDCISPDESKDVVAYLKAESKEESCTLTHSTVNGTTFKGESLCKGGGDKKFTNMTVKSDLSFTPTGYSGTLVETGTGEDDKPFTKHLKISAARKGECTADAPAAAQ